MTNIGPLRVKTRVPPTAWAVAGLVTLFSIVSSLMHSDGTMPMAAQAVPAYHAGVN